MSLEFDNDQASPDESNRGRSTGRARGADAAAPQEDAVEVNRTRPSGSPSLRSMNSALSRSLNRQGTGAALSKTVKAFEALLYSNENPVSGDVIQLNNYRVIPFDAVEQRATMSSVIFAVDLEQDNKTHVFYFTMLVEGSCPPLGAKEHDLNGRRFYNPQTAGDVINDRYLEKVENVVLRAIKSTKEIELHDCGNNVLSSTVDVEKDAQVIYDLSFYMNAAVTTMSVEVLKYQESFNLSWLEKDDSLSVNVVFGDEPIRNANGFPRRTDVKIGLTANIRDEDGLHREPLTIVGGALEMIYSPPAAGDRVYSSFGRRQTEETQVVAPAFVINTWDTAYKAITMELLMLGLASTAVLSSDLFWVNFFKPNSSLDPKEVDYNDTGALNVLPPINGQFFNTKSANFSENDFLDYLGTLCHEELSYLINIEEHGDLTWLHNVLIKATQRGTAEAREEAENAQDYLWAKADELTDNAWSPRAKELGVTDFVVDTENRVLVGDYKDADGNVQDLSNFDLLRWLNLRGEHDPSLALDWQDTFDKIDDPIEYRIDKRIRMLQDALGANNVKVRGYAVQLAIPSNVIKALALAVRDCDIVISRENTTGSYGAARQRGNYRVRQLGGSNLGGDLFSRWAGADRNRDTGRGGNRVFTDRVRHYR
jgi:hypothetical protein